MRRLAHVLALTVGLAALLGCERPPEPLTTEAVQAALGDQRWVLPRLTGFRHQPCAASAMETNLFPATACAGPSLRPEDIPSFADPVDWESPSADTLQARALRRLAQRTVEVRDTELALVDLKEAAAQATPMQRADILSDVAAAHLVQAALQQAPLDVVAALEASLEAIDLAPGHSAAHFNQALALQWLGIPTDGSAPPDPWFEELIASAGDEDDDTACPPRRELRALLDAWSETRDAAGLADLETHLPCFTSTEDRYFLSLWEAIQHDPDTAATAWQTVRRAANAVYGFDHASARQALDPLQTLDSPKAVQLEALWLESILAYQVPDYPRCLRLLGSLIESGRRAQLLELVARAARLEALVHEGQGDYGPALQSVAVALDAAQRAEAESTVAAVLSQQMAIQTLVGREDDAWRSVVQSLRGLNPQTQQRPRLSALSGAAELANVRELHRAADLFLDRAMQLAELDDPVSALSQRIDRGRLWARQGRVALARDELQRADADYASLIAQADDVDPEILQTLETNLHLLRGQVDPDPNRRQAALKNVLQRFGDEGYDRLLIDAQLAQADWQRQQGDDGAAEATLRDALGELEEQVQHVSVGTDAKALVAAARPVIDGLIDLAGKDADAVLRLLRRFQTLRAGQPQVGPQQAPVGEQRLHYFLRSDEVVLLLETEPGPVLARHEIPRDALRQDRKLLLRQLTAGHTEAQLRSAGERLHDVLLEPLEDDINPERPLRIQTDDVLAGLPFAVLPFRDGLVIDHLDLSYGLGGPSTSAGAWNPSQTMVTVGVLHHGDLDPLPRAVVEARQVAAFYTEVQPLLEQDARPDALLQTLTDGATALHVASHFVLNNRAPGRSYLALAEHDGDTGRLPLADLLSAVDGQLDLLYLSACDTGGSLDASPFGLHSLAGLFAGSGVERVVLSLWPLDDAAGSEIAVDVHRHLTEGLPADAALRQAQLEHRTEVPGTWGGLALYQ